MKNLFSFFAHAKHLAALTMVATLMMACEKNDANPPDIPGHDYSVATNASKNVYNILGESKADAQKAILDAGFQVVDNSIFNAPQRVIRLAHAPKDDEDVICFAFNLSPDMVDMTEQEIVNTVIDSKTTAILFKATFNNDILAEVQGRMIVGAEIGNVNTLYLECSEALNSNIKLLGQWNGTVTDPDNGNKETEFSNFHNFYTTVADMNAVSTKETAGRILNLSGTRTFGYAVTWNKPNEAEAREQIKKGYKTAIAEANFSIEYKDTERMK